jgi:hypothetical protein
MVAASRARVSGARYAVDVSAWITIGAGVLLVAAIIALQLMFPGPLGPHRAARRSIKAKLAVRPNLSDTEWASRLEPAVAVPAAFVGWFRRSASRAFGFDLSAALPSDRLMEDLGLYEATWSDAEMDVDVDVECDFNVQIPDDSARRKAIQTLGAWAEYYWDHISRQHPGATGERTPRKPFWRRWRSSKSRASSAGNGPV